MGSIVIVLSFLRETCQINSLASSLTSVGVVRSPTACTGPLIGRRPLNSVGGRVWSLQDFKCPHTGGVPWLGDRLWRRETEREDLSTCTKVHLGAE